MPTYTFKRVDVLYITVEAETEDEAQSFADEKTFYDVDDSDIVQGDWELLCTEEV